MESMMSAKALRSRFPALRTLARDSVDGHRSRPQRPNRFERLNAVASRPALLARAETDRPRTSAMASMAAQICLWLNILLSASERNKKHDSGGSRGSVGVGCPCMMQPKERMLRIL